MKQASRFVQESSLCFFFFFFKFNLLSFFNFCFTFWFLFYFFFTFFTFYFLPWVFGAVRRLLIAVASLAVERDH